MKLSIVSTLYNSSKTVEAFCQRVSAAAAAITDDFEIVLVDDGSPDDSLQIACAIAKTDARVSVVELSRNFGHHRAMMTGLEFATGDLVFLIDSDLEEDPATLGEFHSELERRSADVIYGYQQRRKGAPLERLGGAVAYAVFNMMTSHPIPKNHITVRLMRREYVGSLLQHREQETVIGGLWVITGFKQFGMPVEKLAKKGTSYSFLRRLRFFIESVISFSERPLVGIFYLGILISMLSGLVGLWVLSRKLFFNMNVDGWVSVMLSVWFLGGLLIFCVGVIGVYVSKIFIETKNRPYTIVRRIHRRTDDAGSAR